MKVVAGRMKLSARGVTMEAVAGGDNGDTLSAVAVARGGL